jgi:GTPase SAR1 family protein
MVTRIVDDTFAVLTSTAGIEFKPIKRETSKGPVSILVWETARQEKFKSIAKSYFRNAPGPLLDEIRSRSPPNAAIVLAVTNATH